MSYKYDEKHRASVAELELMFVVDSVKNSDEAVRGLYCFVEGQSRGFVRKSNCWLFARIIRIASDAVPPYFLFETEGNADL